MEKQILTIEEMRYKVPKVCNRFWQVHTRFILSCFVITCVAILISLSVVTVKGIQRLAPNPTIVFFCTIEEYDSVSNELKKYQESIDLFFVEYDHRFDSSSESKTLYDFTELGGDMSNYNNPDKSVLCVALKATQSFLRQYTYESFDLENGADATQEIVEQIVKEVLGK
ncbi:MAG: hypothetical protein NC548_41280 [Lachnospiraceae bacterium]|nr:hypothetical protein [Lachnospiraceae bacterium]